MLAVALVMKLESKGPVIFRQKRFGFDSELVEVFKFRSMYVDRTDANATKPVTNGDPRVRKVGHFIGKTSRDELPQLFNVLTGQLSLLGLHPHATQAKAAEALYEQVGDGYFARHKIKPGISGWAQINGWRGETDTREKSSSVSGTISNTTTTGRCPSISKSSPRHRSRCSKAKAPIDQRTTVTVQ